MWSRSWGQRRGGGEVGFRARAGQLPVLQSGACGSCNVRRCGTQQPAAAACSSPAERVTRPRAHLAHLRAAQGPEGRSAVDSRLIAGRPSRLQGGCARGQQGLPSPPGHPIRAGLPPHLHPSSPPPLPPSPPTPHTHHTHTTTPRHASTHRTHTHRTLLGLRDLVVLWALVGLWAFGGLFPLCGLRVQGHWLRVLH